MRVGGLRPPGARTSPPLTPCSRVGPAPPAGRRPAYIIDFDGERDRRRPREAVLGPLQEANDRGAADAEPRIRARCRCRACACRARAREGRELWALRNVVVRGAAGTILGIIGANGAGKSTLLKIIARVIRPTEGRVIGHGRVVSLLELGAGFNPDFSARDNILMNAAMHGIPRREALDRLDEIVQFAELERVPRQRAAALLERHVPAPGVLGRHQHAAGHPAGRRDPRRRRHGVPGALPRARGAGSRARADRASSCRTTCRRCRASATASSGSTRASCGAMAIRSRSSPITRTRRCGPSPRGRGYGETVGPSRQRGRGDRVGAAAERGRRGDWRGADQPRTSTSGSG